MPEGVEIRLFKDLLTKEKIDKFTWNNKDYDIVKIKVKGKTLHLLSKEVILFFNFGLTGEISLTKNKYTKYDLGKFYYNDQLNFGKVRLLNYNEYNKIINKIGTDIFKIKKEEFIDKISGCKNKKLVECIVNQKLISGIGNYLRSEIMWKAGLDIFETKKDKKTLTKLFKACKYMIKYHYKGVNDGVYVLPANKEYFVYKQNKDIFNNNVFETTINKRKVYYTK